MGGFREGEVSCPCDRSSEDLPRLLRCSHSGELPSYLRQGGIVPLSLLCDAA